MKGIILSGGLGKRLQPITKAVVKQLLPVYDKPMIYYPLSVLMLAKISEVMIISTKDDLPLFQKLLGNGNSFGMKIEYAVQEKPEGIAQAFTIAKDFIGKDDVALILGDNLFYGQSFTSILEKAIKNISENKGCVIFGYPVHDPSAYGVIEFDKNHDVKKITEKPKNPKSNYAVPGLYFYDNNVVKIAEKIKPGKRGELEITDVNNEYIKNKNIKVELLGRGMVWLDTGTYDSLLEASNYIATIQKRQGFYVGCPEEIAYKNQWISKKNLLETAKNYSTDYGKYLEYIAKNY